MQIKNPLHKTKNFFQKNLESLKYVLLFGKRQKAHKPSSLNPFPCGTWNPKSPQSAQVYSDFFDDWKKNRDDHIITAQKQLPISEEDTNRANMTKLEKKSPEKSNKERNVEEKKTATSHLRKGDDLSSRSLSKGCNVLAKKMKELDVVERGDLEQVLDIEEAAHYYSRLKSPVYIDIVDNFFTDMYSELSAPKPASSINSSKRRIGSLRF